MDRKKLLVIIGSALGLVIIVIAIAIGSALQQPQPPLAQQDDYTGNLSCLPHKNAQEGEPQTLECAIGLKAIDGRYYGLKDMPSEADNIEFATKITVRGELIKPSADEKYDIAGTIQVSAVDTTP